MRRIRERLRSRTIAFGAALALAAGAGLLAAPGAAELPAPHYFTTGDQCQACHNGLISPDGEDVSIGLDWRASMMAQSARDPYWQAAVRREVLDHPTAAEAIEDECSRCHMPMANTAERAAGRGGAIFAHLPVRDAGSPIDRLAADGVSCTVCHQIKDEGLGTEASFTGGFVIDTRPEPSIRPMFGPFNVVEGQASIMRSAVLFQPSESRHVQRSELCATCHTLYTRSLGANGEVIGELPEQVPYLEWRHSAYRASNSCQSCHMPVVESDTPISSVLGAPRSGLSRHVFVGGNFFVLRMLGRYRDELGTATSSRELDTSAERTLEQLRRRTARLAVERAELAQGRLRVVVRVENLTGHKLPTAYPSRRVWLHVRVSDAQGALLFESGAMQPSGAITGNDNDASAASYEPHHDVISNADHVQIYESIMSTPNGRVTTGLLSATQFIKDNRLLPHGFDKATAEPDIRVRGDAAEDPSFQDGVDRVSYELALDERRPPFEVRVALRYQPIAYRWAHNLKRYAADEPRRFVEYYEDMAAGSAALLDELAVQVAADTGSVGPSSTTPPNR